MNFEHSHVRCCVDLPLKQRRLERPPGTSERTGRLVAVVRDSHERTGRLVAIVRGLGQDVCGGANPRISCQSTGSCSRGKKAVARYTNIGY